MYSTWKESEPATRLFEKASERLAAGCFHKATVEELVEGSSTGTLYHYFESRDGLVTAVVEQATAQWREHMNEALDGVEGTTGDRVETFISAALDHPSIRLIIKALTDLPKDNPGWRTAVTQLGALPEAVHDLARREDISQRPTVIEWLVLLLLGAAVASGAAVGRRTSDDRLSPQQVRRRQKTEKVCPECGRPHERGSPKDRLDALSNAELRRVVTDAAQILVAAGRTVGTPDRQ